jgi:hypothetical protein
MTDQATIDRMRDIADNLDCVDASDLNEFIDFLGDFNVPLARTRELWGELNDETVKVTQSLRMYAHFKIAAIGFRRKGYIQTAIALEDNCQKIYDQLPTTYQW